MNTATETPTLRQVLWTKFVRFVEKTPLRAALAPIGLSFLAGLLSSLLVAPDAFSDTFTTIMAWRDGVVPITAWSFAFVFGIRPAYRFAAGAIARLFERGEEAETIEGIPTGELIDHLFEHKSFKRQEIEAKFAIPRNRYSELAERMESVGILIRGENNSRVLNPAYSRERVAEHLVGKGSAVEIDSFRVVHSPSPLFTSRAVSKA